MGGGPSSDEGPLTSAAVFLLLPPSEAKAAGGDGPAVGARPSLSTPGLREPRRVLLSALRQAVKDQPEELARGLKLPSSVAGAALTADATASRAATMAALDRYVGVLYQGLAAWQMSTAARRRADEQVLVLSGLWGVVRGGDLIPDYRVPASGSVPGLGGVAAHWRGPLSTELPSLIGSAEVIDLRSSDYRALWRPIPELRRQVLTVRVLAARGTQAQPVAGPVSYHAKLIKGQVARDILIARPNHRGAREAVEHAAAVLGLKVVDAGDAAAPSVDLVGKYP